MTDAPPQPPESLPKYLADGVPKQDNATLRDLHTYVDELLEYRVQATVENIPADEDDIVEDKNDGDGVVVKEKVRCGDDSCHCADGGELHGPYLYRYLYKNGSLTSEYVGKPGAE